jgi:Zn-dependent alcohol dehydrogenase
MIFRICSSVLGWPLCFISFLARQIFIQKFIRHHSIYDPTILFLFFCWLKNEAQRAYPRIFGHEASGIVESVGEGVTDMKEGDHVVPIFNGECGDCIYCKCEKTNMCERSGVNPFKTVMVNDGKSRFSSKEGKPIFHFLNTSTFSEYTVLESACVVKIDSHVPLKKMTLLSCGVSTGKKRVKYFNYNFIF